MFKDVNECAEGKHNCSQLCVDTLESFICKCEPGHDLNDDGTTCNPSEYNTYYYSILSIDLGPVYSILEHN